MASDIPIYSISGERAVVSTGGKCPYKCRYCFVRAGGYQLLDNLSIDEIAGSVRGFPPEVGRIELGLDKDPMHNQQSALELISRLAESGKDVSFATKADLTDETIARLAGIGRAMASEGRYLFTKVSLMGFETARAYEPNAPDPDRRVDTVRRLHEAGLPTIIYIKPILPDLPDDEIERVLQATGDFCNAYVAGYFIYDEEMAKEMGIGLSNEKMVMEWDPSKREWHVYKDPRIKELTKKGNVFAVSREAIEHVKRLFPLTC